MTGPPPALIVAGGEDGVLRVRVPYNPELVRRIRTVPGRRLDPRRRVWRVPHSAESRTALRAAFGSTLRFEPSPACAASGRSGEPAAAMLQLVRRL